MYFNVWFGKVGIVSLLIRWFHSSHTRKKLYCRLLLRFGRISIDQSILIMLLDLLYGTIRFLQYKTRHYVLFTEPTIIKVNANELSPYGK